jgi:hypothetical protein
MLNKNFFIFAIFSLIALSSFNCQRVDPNHIGVLMEHYGKNGKSDYSLQTGQVWTASFSGSKKLFEIPTYTQRGDWEDQTIELKAADNTEFKAKPLYSYKIIPKRAVDVVFNNARLESKNFMETLENNVIEPEINDLLKEHSSGIYTDSLMMGGGRKRFEQEVEEKVSQIFEKYGLYLETFSLNLDFSDKVKAKIDVRNETNTNVSVLDQQVIEQRKRNELAELETEYNIIRSRGLTTQILQEMWIKKWNGNPSHGSSGSNFTIPLK